jgi:hypothetical protein
MKIVSLLIKETGGSALFNIDPLNASPDTKFSYITVKNEVKRGGLGP